MVVSSTEADKRTLIPIKYRSCDIPDILRYIAMLDYTREDTKPWFWQRLASSLRTAAPQSAILHPFIVGPAYPLTRSFSTTSVYPTQPPPHPWFPVDFPEPVLAAPEPAASQPSAEIRMVPMPVSAQSLEVQSSEPQESDQPGSPTRRASSRHHSSPGHTSNSSRLKLTFLRTRKK